MELFKTKDLSLEECLEIFRKYFPVALVKKIARQSIEEQTARLSQEEKELIKKEALEIELDFLKYFQKEKNIPLAFSQGHYVGGYRETREGFLETASNTIESALESPQAFIQYLASDPEWRSYFSFYSSSVKEKLKSLEEDKSLKGLAIYAKADSLTDEETRKKYAEVEQNFESSSTELLAHETEKVLLEYSLI